MLQGIEADSDSDTPRLKDIRKSRAPRGINRGDLSSDKDNYKTTRICNPSFTSFMPKMPASPYLQENSRADVAREVEELLDRTDSQLGEQSCEAYEALSSVAEEAKGKKTMSKSYRERLERIANTNESVARVLYHRLQTRNHTIISLKQRLEKKDNLDTQRLHDVTTLQEQIKRLESEREEVKDVITAKLDEKGIPAKRLHQEPSTKEHQKDAQLEATSKTGPSLSLRTMLETLFSNHQNTLQIKDETIAHMREDVRKANQNTDMKSGELTGLEMSIAMKDGKVKSLQEKMGSKDQEIEKLKNLQEQKAAETEMLWDRVVQLQNDSKKGLGVIDEGAWRCQESQLCDEVRDIDMRIHI